MSRKNSSRNSRSSRLRGISLLVAGVMIGGLLISPASAHITRNVSHAVKHMKKFFYTKKQANNRYYTKTQANNRYYTRTQANNRFVNHCDEEEFPWVQNLAQATIDGESTDTEGYSGDGVLGEIDCATLATGVLVKKMGTGVHRVAFPDWWSDPEFLDDLPLVVVQALHDDGVSASYEPVGEPGVGTVVEVHTRAAGSGDPTDSRFHVVVTGWAFDFFDAGGVGAAARDGSKSVSGGYGTTRG